MGILGTLIFVLSSWSAEPPYQFHYSVEHEEPADWVRMSEGALYTGGRDGFLKRFDLETGKLLYENNMGDWINLLELIPGSQHLLVSTYSGDLFVLDGPTGRTLFPLIGHKDFIESVEFAPKGALMVTASLDKSAILWNRDTGQKIRQLPHPDFVQHAKFSEDGSKIVTSCDDENLRIWDTESGRQILSLRTRPSGWPPKYASFGRNGLVSITGNGADLWSLTARKVLRSFSGHKDMVMAYALTENFLATGANDNWIRLWSLREGRLMAKIPGPEPVTIQFSAQGDFILVGLHEGRTILWSIPQRKVIQSFEGHDKEMWVQARISDDTVFLATTSGDGKTILYRKRL